MTEETQSQPDEAAENTINDIVARVNYVRNWLDCAPDFPVLIEALVVKIAMDRGGQLVDPEEIARVEQWTEKFYKDMSAMVGLLDGHIEVVFPPNQPGPSVKLTEKGTAWVREHHAQGPPQTQN